MPKLFAKSRILMPDNTLVEPLTVFTASVDQAKQFDKLKVARPATPEEIKADEDRRAEEDGTAFLETVAEPEAAPEVKKLDSGAPGDPQSSPKGGKGQ